MPKCVDCGAETEREAMFGPRDDLRCWACVKKIQERYDPFTPQFRPTMQRPPVVIALIAGAGALTLLFWGHRPFVLNYLLATPPAIWDGQLWRFLTAALIHGNAIHLLFNLYWIWIFGKATEEWMGSLLFAGFVIVTALGSSAAQFLIGGSGIGLSGVVYALFGFLYALRWYKDFAAALIQPQVVNVFVGWFFLGIAVTYFNIYPIGNTAHGAGAVIGFLFGKAVLAPQRKLLIPGVVILVGLLTAGVYTPWQPHYATYQGYQAIQRRDFPAALTWFRRAAEADPGNEGLRRQVELLEQLERLDEKQ